jgi:hypothetical protein
LIHRLAKSLRLSDRAQFPRFAVATLTRRRRISSKHRRRQKRAP